MSKKSAISIKILCTEDNILVSMYGLTNHDNAAQIILRHFQLEWLEDKPNFRNELILSTFEARKIILNFSLYQIK